MQASYPTFPGILSFTNKTIGYEYFHLRMKVYFTFIYKNESILYFHSRMIAYWILGDPLDVAGWN